MAGRSDLIDSLSFDLRSDCNCDNLGDKDDGDLTVGDLTAGDLTVGDTDGFDFGAGNETWLLIGCCS